MYRSVHRSQPVARPSPRIDSRTRILDAALDLFHQQGVAATGLDQILAVSGTGKGQFYHWFGSKDDLVLEVMRHHRARVASGTVPVPRDLQTWKDLEGWFAFFVAALEGGGCTRSCPIGTMAVEFGDDQAALRDEAGEIFRGAREPLVQLFRTLQKAGKLRRGVDAQALADFCYTVMQGGLLVGKIERSSTPFRNAVRQVLAHLETLRS